MGNECTKKRCRYHPRGVECEGGDCGRCGWNPEVAIERIVALRAERGTSLGEDVENTDIGEWIDAGNKRRTLGTPYSEKYECSLCRYECYTVLMGPPKRCPQCHAEMKNGVAYEELIGMEE